jgi:FtsP/CotA-like multicopper oxidase with cupredoxin domain
MASTDQQLADLSALETRLQQRESRRDGWMFFVFALSAGAIFLTIFGMALGVRAMQESRRNANRAVGITASSDAKPTVVRLGDLTIAPTVINATAAGGLDVQNGGQLQHDLTIEGQDLKTPLIAPGDSARLELDSLGPGTYTIFCDVAGHRQGGMQAELHVTTGAGGEAAAAASSHAAAGHPMSPEEMDAMMAVRTKAFPAKTAGAGAQPLEPTVLPDGTKRFDLTADVVRWEVEPGKLVDAWTYNGTVPGPTIRVNPGDKVRVVLRNELPESTSIHFHGLELPNALDGVPDITQPPVKPGQTYTYDFVAQSTAAVGMYHSHHNAVTQVSNGLAGAILVGAQPVPAGVTIGAEQVMMLNDTGTIGFSINGKSFPATAPFTADLGEWIEVHYMNEGASVHPMHLHGLAQTVIAKDGYPLAQPYQADTVLVGPGERYTVLVRATLSGTWAWHCHILSHAEREDGMFGMVTALIVS